MFAQLFRQLSAAVVVGISHPPNVISCTLTGLVNMLYGRDCEQEV